MAQQQWRPLGDILSSELGVDPAVITEASAEAGRTGQTVDELLRRKKLVDEETLTQALALQSGLSYLAEPRVDASALALLNRVPIGYARENLVVPLRQDEQGLQVALSDPGNNRVLNDLAMMTGGLVNPCLSSRSRLLQAINQGYELLADGSDSSIAEIEDANGAHDEDVPLDDLLDTSDEAPIIRFVNSMLTQAYRRRASDIHIEPFENVVLIRYRIDGVLYEIHRTPRRALANVTSRVKIMANLDIAEKRLPQDGRFSVRIAGKEVDVRVSTLPTAHGERVVLRLLDKSAGVLSLTDIGIDDQLLPQMSRMIHKSYGIVLVTGPTGAGKTTTLYSALSALDASEQNIITVEDPIEYQLAGVGQIQVNPKIDLTFAQGLRSILRQDPDVIMVGEIRDSETAKIAVQAALTGHLVFSTLHTNDSAGALARLVEMGVEPFLAASALVGVLAQRLVRKVCPHCREAYQPEAQLLEQLCESAAVPADAIFYRGRGCEQCMQIGYLGRTGLYELLTVTDPVRQLVTANADAATIRHQAVKEGMIALRQAGLNKILAGETTVEEVLRVTQEEV